MGLIRNDFAMAVTTSILLAARTVRADFDGPGNGGPPGGSGFGGNFGGDGSGNSGNNGSPGQQGSFAGGTNDYSHIITIHAALACLVWVFLIPVGGILIRAGLKSPWILRIHAVLQSLSFLIYIVAVGCGIYLVRSIYSVSNGQANFWQDSHIKLGLAILVLAFIQPILGLIHHTLYKRRAMAFKTGSSDKKPGRTVPGYAHLWLGRTLIVLGMINGGLGLRLAASPFENQQPKIIAYAVGAAIMGILYIAFAILGERRRVNERKTQDQSAVPLVTRYQAAPAAPYSDRHPPSYEASEENVAKGPQTTARYS